MQLNNIRKSSSHSTNISKRSTLNYKRRSQKYFSNRSISNSHFLSAKIFFSFSSYTCGDFVTNLLTTENFLQVNGFGDQKMLILTIKDPKLFGYQKEINILVLQEQIKRTYRKGMQVDSLDICAERKKILKLIRKPMQG